MSDARDRAVTEGKVALERATWPPCRGQDQHDTFAAREIAETVVDALAAAGLLCDDAADEGYPCGHVSRVAGCGGCDPGAIDAIYDDTERRWLSSGEVAAERARLGAGDAPRHVAAVEQLADGTWGVHCLACSDAAGDYVRRCKVRADWPPMILRDDALADALRKLIDMWDNKQVEPQAFYPEANAWANGVEAGYSRAADVLRYLLAGKGSSDA